MKNAQAKIDALLDVMVVRLEAGVGSLGTATWTTPEAIRSELEWLIRMSNLNNAKQEKVGRQPGPQAKEAADVTNADLVAQLKAGRDPDLFPRRGPRKGKRENAGKPEIVWCAVHDAIQCVGTPPVCPECAKKPENVPPTFVTLKALL